MATANTIESFFSLINRVKRHPAQRTFSDHRYIDLRCGELIELPSDSHVSVVAGQVWLTHRGDALDHFPVSGDSFDTTKWSKSLIQALADSTILIQ